jgi:hypothetical protein
MLSRTLMTVVVAGSLLAGPNVWAHPATEPPRPERRSGGVGLTVGGLGILAINYAAVAGVVGSQIRKSQDPEHRRQIRPLLVPVVGSLISATRATTPGGRFGTVTLGILQAAMLGLGIAGVIVLGQERHRRSHSPQTRSMSFDGMGLRLRF